MHGVILQGARIIIYIPFLHLPSSFSPSAPRFLREDSPAPSSSACFFQGVRTRPRSGVVWAGGRQTKGGYRA